MRNQTIFLGSWFGALVSSLAFSLIFLIYTSSEQKLTMASNSYRLYQALPNSKTQISDSIGKGDARAQIIEDFFNKYKSELATVADQFIETSDRYRLDYRLLPAIAMQESNGGKRMPKDSFNPFGFGIYGSKLLRFESFEESIDTVGKTLRENYLDQGLKTPFEIMTKYTPSSEAKGSPWAKGVTSFMEELR